MNLSNVILLNLAAARPPAGVAGRLFFASDTHKVYRDSGAAWNEVTAAAPLLPMGFLVAWGGGTATGIDIAGHRYVGIACVPRVFHVGCKTAPSGGDMTITVNRVRGGVSTPITAAPLTIAAGALAASTEAFPEGMAFQPGDYLTVDAAQSAGTPGLNVFVEILCQGA